MNKENILNKLEVDFIVSIIQELDLLGIKAELNNFRDGFGPYQDQFYYDFRTLNQTAEYSIWIHPWYFDDEEICEADITVVVEDINRAFETQDEWRIDLPPVSEGNEEDQNIECMTNVLNTAPQIAKEIKEFIGGCN